MREPERQWVPVANYGWGFEADLAVALLEGAGIPAIRRDRDIVGIFGPGFQGPTARGVDVLVPSDAVDAARALLADAAAQAANAALDDDEEPELREEPGPDGSYDDGYDDDDLDDADAWKRR